MFYTRVTDFLEALNIDTEEADDCCTGSKQPHMMFEGEDRKILQSLIDNGTLTLESQKTPRLALDATGATIKSEEHFWHFQNELLSNVCKFPNEGIHALSTHICTLISQCKFTHPKP